MTSEPTMITENDAYDEVAQAISRIKGHSLALALMRGRRLRADSCQAVVDNGLSSKGKRYQSWQCCHPVTGKVDGRNYCSTHLPKALEAHTARLADQRLVESLGLKVPPG